MASANPPSNPNTKTSKIEYPVGGIPVQFPYQPYGSQLAFMGRVISTLDRAQREGHCHALLESPTGTGKSLSLLCSSLAWQQNYKAKNQYANLTLSKPAPEAFTDPLAHGGGFVPEMDPSGNMPSETPGLAQSTANSTNPKKKTIPTIFYATRTHSQISQVIREYRKTAYRVPMAILASRKHYCTNARVRGKGNVDEECKLLLKDRDAGCLHFKNANKVKGHPSLQKGGCHEAHDIEDLVKVGQAVKGCSYYAARSMADHAQLVFCPYSYIINPIIRGAMEVDIKGAILILDEAHNIEDIARDAGSVDVEEDNLLKLQTELDQLCNVNALVYQPLYEMIQDLLSWIQRKKPTLEKREFQHYCSCWTGDKAIRELQEANISQQCFPILLECVTKAIRAATDTESEEEAHLSGMSVILLEGLFSSLTYFFSRNGSHIFDFQLALRRYVKKDAGSAVGNLTQTLSLWCLNPSVVFRDIAELSLSVILTSGTLSPMNSFSSELGVQFGTCLEAPHVIDVDSQVWATIMTTGAGNYPMNASFKTADGYGFQDALGKSLEDICNIVPGGALVFFPSYKLMDKLSNRWRETGQWSRLNARKSLFVEPRGSQDDFEHVLKDYYDTIYNRPTVGKKRRVKKLKVNHFNAIESPEDSKREGAAFLAVCRGKVSEGIDFSDDNARVVIVVGIPYPNMYDIQVELKKKYNDTYKSSKNLLSGNEWYCYQAFRALNQAAGRCIRHKFDYGAIILLDERYQYERNRAYISKWLKKCFKQYDNFDMSLEGLRSFFKDVKERVCNNTMTASHKSEIKEDNISFMDDCKGLTGKKYEKPKKSGSCGQKLVSTVDATFPRVNFKKDVIDQTSVQLDVDTKSCIEVIDLECSSPKYLRCLDAVSTPFSHEDPEISIVNETPDMDGSITTPSPGSFSRDGNSCSTVFQTSDFQKQVACCSISSTNPSKVPSRDQCLMAFTPEKNVNAVVAPDKESPLNVSVNSHFQKRRKSIARDRQLDAPDADTPGPGCISFVQSEMTARDANRRIEFGFEINSAEHEFKKSSVTRLTTISNCTASWASCAPAVDKRLQIACSLCKSLLGLPENHLYVTCSLTTSSKVHIVSLLRDRLGPHALNTSTGIPVVMADVSSVDQRLCNGIREGAQGQGIWCEADGCVFSNIFCPFCSTRNNCLGVQIKATDSSNVQLLNKILFCSEFLEIKNPEVSNDKISSEKNIEVRNNKTASDKDLLPVSASSVDKIAAFNSIDKFSYSQQEVSRGWRTTKSKLRLPKRALLSDVEG